MLKRPMGRFCYTDDMKAMQIETSNQQIILVEPQIERDALLGVQWLGGKLGRNTLQLMGVADKDNRESSLENECKRVKEFIEDKNHLNWMIQLDNKVVGSVWVDLEATDQLPAPSVHIMIGDATARGQGVGTASINAVLEYLKQQGEDTVYSRTLVKNTVAANLLLENAFQPFEEPYVDTDGLEWQNAQLKVAK
jgi:RimJ/RimL family protein N-acetyltransferase